MAGGVKEVSTVEYELSIEEHNLMCKYIQRGFKDTLRRFLEGLTSSASGGGSGETMVIVGKSTFAPDPNSNRIAPLVLAAMEGRIQIVQLFLEVFKGQIDINHGSYLAYPDLFLLDFQQVQGIKSRGVTAINAACISGLTDIVKLFAQAGANVNKVDYFGFSPLGNAARYGRKEVVEFLLRRGANVTLKTHDDYTAMHLAAYYGQTEIVQLMLSKMISPCYPKANKPPVTGAACPMYLAAARGWQPVVEVFSEHQQCPTHCKIDAALLLGAAARMFWSTITPENVSGVTELWKEARKKTDLRGGSRTIVPPIKAYGNRKELLSEKDIQVLSENPEFEVESLYQCLLIHERCMGRQNSYNWVFLAGIRMFQNKLFEEAQDLWEHSIELHYDNAKEHIGMDNYWQHDLKGCMEYMLQLSSAVEVMMQENVIPRWSAYTEYALQQLKLGILTNLQTNLLDPTQGILKVYFCLLQIFSGWVSTTMDPPTLPLQEGTRTYPEDLERHGQSYVDTVSVITQSNLIHLSIHPAAPIIHHSDHWQTLKRLPNLLFALLEWGACINIDDVDHNGERPLHIAAKLPGRDLRNILIPILLRFGAHPDAMNHSGQTPQQVFNSAYPTEKSPFPDEPRRLSCLAVDHILKHKLPYNSRKIPAQVNLIFKLHTFGSSSPHTVKKITLPNLF